GGVGLRDHEHVRLVDRLPAANGRAVKAQAVVEDAFSKLVGGNGEVLPETGEVHEAQIDGADFLLTDQGQDFFGCHRTTSPESDMEWRRCMKSLWTYQPD